MRLRSRSRLRARTAGATVQWYQAAKYTAADGSTPTIIADFRNNRYAVPSGINAAGVAGASLAQLRNLTAGAFSDVFAYTASSSGSGRTYINSSGTVKTDIAVDGQRLDYTNGVQQLLLENASTNICIRGGDTSSGEWTVGNCTKTSGQADPAGGTGAALITGLGGGSANSVNSSASSTILYILGTTYTFSRFVKAGTQSLVQLTANTGAFGSGQYANFDISNGTVTQSAGCTPSITGPYNGWYRIAITVTCTTQTSTFGGTVCFITNGTSTRLSGFSGTTTFYIWGAQVEASSFPTSYIDTAAATVTRAIETARFSTLVEAILQRSAGSVVARTQNILRDAGRIVGASGTVAFLLRQNATVVRTFDGTTVLSATVGSGSFGITTGAAVAFDSGGRALAFQGGTVATDTVASPGTRTAIYLGRDGTPNYADGWYDELIIYPNKITNASAQSLAVAYT